MIKPFKIIFRQVGKVRDLHIEEANFKKHLQEKVLVALRAELTKQQLKEKKLFFSLISEKTIKQLKNKYNKTVAFLYEVDSQKVDDYMLKKRNEIKVFLNQPHLEEQPLHEFRKLLKIYYYNEMKLSVEPQIIKKTQKNPLTELLGKWNDRIVITGHLQKNNRKS